MTRDDERLLDLTGKRSSRIMMADEVAWSDLRNHGLHQPNVIYFPPFHQSAACYRSNGAFL